MPDAYGLPFASKCEGCARACADLWRRRPLVIRGSMSRGNRPPARREPMTFDAPGAGTGSGQGTFPNGINEPGTITGYYIDNNDVSHGFLRTRTHGSP